MRIPEPLRAYKMCIRDRVNLVSHRGRTLSYDISRYADLTETRDGDNVSYELTLSVGDYGIGDEVRVLCPALGISARRRIICLLYTS